MELEQYLKQIPEKWVFSLEQPRLKGMRWKEGDKKPRSQRYTAFVANDRIFGTPGYQSAFFDANDMREAIMGAMMEVQLKMEQSKVKNP